MSNSNTRNTITQRENRGIGETGKIGEIGDVFLLFVNKYSFFSLSSGVFLFTGRGKKARKTYRPRKQQGSKLNNLAICLSIYKIVSGNSLRQRGSMYEFVRVFRVSGGLSVDFNVILGFLGVLKGFWKEFKRDFKFYMVNGKKYQFSDSGFT